MKKAGCLTTPHQAAGGLTPMSPLGSDLTLVSLVMSFSMRIDNVRNAERVRISRVTAMTKTERRTCQRIFRIGRRKPITGLASDGTSLTNQTCRDLNYHITAFSLCCSLRLQHY